jgi:CheY-like chemotaxis protein
MFFASKIRATAEHLGLDVRFEKNSGAAIEAARAELPFLIIADLHAQKYDPFALAEQLKIDEHLRSIPLIGFFSHVQTALQRRAEQAGFDRILPRSAFSKHLPEILEGKR